MNHLDDRQTWFIIGYGLTAIFYPLESMGSHFIVSALRSMDHELVESLLQQHNITFLHCLYNCLAADNHAMAYWLY